MHLGKATKQVTQHDVLRSLGIPEHCEFILSKWLLAKDLYRHIEVVDTCRCCVRCEFGHIQFYSGQHRFVDHTPQAQAFQLETINFNLGTHLVYTVFVIVDEELILKP